MYIFFIIIIMDGRGRRSDFNFIFNLCFVFAHYLPQYILHRERWPPCCAGRRGGAPQVFSFFVLLTLTTLYSEGLKMVERSLGWEHSSMQHLLLRIRQSSRWRLFVWMSNLKHFIYTFVKLLIFGKFIYWFGLMIKMSRCYLCTLQPPLRSVGCT